MFKKGAIGIGLLISIALLLYLMRLKAKGPDIPVLTGQTVRTDYVSLTLPNRSWACMRGQDANGCTFNECKDMNSQRTDLAYIRLQWRPLTDGEKQMDGRYVNLDTPVGCGPGLGQVPLTEHTTAPLQGADWRVIHVRGDSFDSRFYVNRIAGMAVQVEVAIRLGPFLDDNTKLLKPVIESFQLHGTAD